MKLIVVGSQAINEALPVHHKLVRGKKEYVEIDLIGTLSDLSEYAKQTYPACTVRHPTEGGKKYFATTPNRHFIVDGEIAWPGTTGASLLEILENNPNLCNQHLTGPEYIWPNLNVLYTIKMSHRFKKNSPHFKKTMDDILVMRKVGARIPVELSEWFIERQKETYDYGHPNLKTTKEEFFGRDDIYTYDHDSIHVALAKRTFDDKPAYDYFKPEGEEVLTSKEMFYDRSFIGRLRATYEESCVLALERSQIPYPNVDRKKSFLMALEKVCTSITSGWFREFSWENYYSTIELYDDLTSKGQNYKDIFDKALEAGEILPYK